jgi:hypothetical protein
MKLSEMGCRIAAVLIPALACASCTTPPSRLPPDARVTFTSSEGTAPIQLPVAAAKRFVAIVNSSPTRTEVDQITYYGGGFFEVEGRQYRCNVLGIYYIREVLRSPIAYYWEDDPAIVRMKLLLTGKPEHDLTPQEVIEELER